MIADKEKWIEATANLKKRRASGTAQKPGYNPVSDYKSHLEKCGFGRSVLDIGCGSQYLKTCLPDGIEYVGIDPFMESKNRFDVISLAIEDLTVRHIIPIDTVCAMAVLDNCRDFYKACENMKQIARYNVIILTGIGIDVDEFHTFRLEHEHFEKAFGDWVCTWKEEIAPKVWLLNYDRP